MDFIPLMVDLSQKQVVVIGGGKIAARRVSVLTQYTKRITVVSPTVTEGLEHLAKQQSIQWHNKIFENSDVEKADLIVAATNDVATNQAILNAKPSKALINMVGKANAGDILFPSILRRGKLTISISTQGASPMLTTHILEALQQYFNSAYGDYVDFLYDCRQRIKHSSLISTEKETLLKKMLNEKYLNINKQQEVRKWLDTLD